MSLARKTEEAALKVKAALKAAGIAAKDCKFSTEGDYVYFAGKKVEACIDLNHRGNVFKHYCKIRGQDVPEAHLNEITDALRDYINVVTATAKVKAGCVACLVVKYNDAGFVGTGYDKFVPVNRKNLKGLKWK